VGLRGPAERLGDKIVSPWGRILTVAELVTITAEHEEEHATVVQDLRKAKYIRGETRT